MAGYIPGFDVVRYDSKGFRIPVTTGTVNLNNLNDGAGSYTRAISSDGVVAKGSLTGSAGDIIEVSHSTYTGKCYFTLTATQDEAFTTTDNACLTYVAENLNSSTTTTNVTTVYAVDVNNPTVAPVRIGEFRSDATTLLPYQTTIDQDLRLRYVSKAENEADTGYDLNTAPYDDITVPGTGGAGSVTSATATEVLTGTDSAKVVTPDTLAALWEQGSNVASATTTSLGEGGYFNITGTTTITDIDFATDKAGRRAWLKFAGALTLTHNASTLILPTGANITTVAGDTAEFISEGTDVVRCVSYQRASGSALVDSSGTAATTTEALTGTDTTKFITADALAAVWEAGSDIASAGTITVGEGGQFNITGTTTITDIDFGTDKTGRTVWFKFAGALTLTHNPTTLILSSSRFASDASKNITTAAGDIACFRSEGSDVVRLLHYQRAANFPRTQKEVYLEQFGHTNSGLAAAISAISTTRTKLVVTEDLTVSTSQTIPTTCVLEIRNNALITISSSATLTIGKFADPGNVQCFTGVSSANHILFAAGALPRDTVNLGWFGVSNDDMTYPVTDICTSLTTNGGGTIFVPVGNWKVNNITLPTYFVRVRGEAMGSDTGGSRFIPKDSGTSYLFNVRNNFRNISFEHCALSVGTNTTTNAFNIDVDTGSSGFGIDFDHVLFHGSGSSSYPLLNTVTDSGAAEFVRGSVTNSQFIIPNGSTGMYVDSINTQIPVSQSTFSVGSGSSYGIYYYRNAEPSVTNCDFRGVAGSYSQTSAGTGTFTVNSGSTLVTGTFTRAMLGQEFAGTGVTAGTYISQIYTSTTAKLSAAASANNTGTYTWYKYVENTSRAGTCILVGDIGGAFIQGCQEEGFNYFVHVIGVGLDRPTVLVANDIQDRIKLEGTCSLHLVGNARHSNSLVDTSGSSSEIISTDYVGPNLPESLAVTLVEANDWSQLRAGSSYFKQNTGNKVGLYQQEFPYFTRILEESASELTRPLLDVSTTYESSGVTGQILQRWGLNDAVSKTQQYGLTLNRSDPATDAGYWIWKTTQAHPYNGELRNFVTGYGADVHAAVTQGTSRTTAVTCNSATGVITCYTYASTQLQPGESITFTLNNTYIKNGCHFDVQVIDGAVGTKTEADSFDWGGNAATITVKNGHLSTAETSTALKLKFHVWADGGQSGRTP